jgi:hypothetical protein
MKNFEFRHRRLLTLIVDTVFLEKMVKKDKENQPMADQRIGRWA